MGMKILITESQYRKILSEAKVINDLRGKFPNTFRVSDSGNFYVIMTNMGNMVIVDDLDEVHNGEYSYGIEKSDRGKYNDFGGMMGHIKGDVVSMFPPELIAGDKIKIQRNDNIGGILYVNPKKKTIQNLLDNEYVKIGYKDYKYNTNKYFDTDKVRKTIKELISKGIINDKFKYIHPNQEDATDNTTDYTGKEQYLYHGTTQNNSNRIMRIGLRPIDTKDLYNDTDKKSTLFRGNSSTLRGYTDKNIYLTPSLDIAKQYARRQSDYNNDEPVVLKVRVPDVNNLVLDDDTVLSVLGKKIHEDLKGKFSEPVKKGDYSFGYKTIWSGEEEVINFPTYVNLLWRSNFMSLVEKGEYVTYTDLLLDPYSMFKDSDFHDNKMKLSDTFFTWLKDKVVTYYKEIRNKHYKKGAFDSNEQSIAYRGSIPPKFISVVPVKYKLKKDN